MSETGRPAPSRGATQARSWFRVDAVFQIIVQLRGYRPEWLVSDVMAGLAIAAVALPTGIAYPAIAGLPVETGIYASVLALIGYAIFGSSRQLIVGPDVATLTVLAAALAYLSVNGPQERAAAAASFAVVVGILCLLSAACRLGFIANFLSRPVLTGYLCGIALSLLASQIERLTAVHVESPGLLRPLIEAGSQLHRIHIPTLVAGLIAFVLLRVLKRAAPRVPGPVVLLVVGTLASILFDLQSLGIALLGPISSALPSRMLHIPELSKLDDFLLSALGVLVVSFGSGIITARSFADKNRYRVDANRELIGLGAANLTSGLFGGFPVTGADSRTAVNDAVGGRTQVAGLVAAAALIFVLIALTSVLKYLPVATLGAILASTAVDLFDTRELRRLWQASRVEFLFAMIAIVGVVGLGVLKGVIIAIGATGVYLIAIGSRPRDALLGRIPGRDGLHKLHREPRAKPIPGLAIYLVQGDLVFFSVDHVRDRIRWIVRQLPAATQWFIIDGQSTAYIDVTAAAALDQVREELQQQQIRLGFANLQSQPRRLLRKAGLLASVGTDMSFDRAEDAVLAFEKSQREQ